MDGLLVDCNPAFLTERRPWWPLRLWFPEKLRCGTIALFKTLIRRQCQIWIYTSSGRSFLYLKLWFRALGIRLDGVVNKSVHERMVSRYQFSTRTPTKFPPLFGIHLHVDDSEGVAIEGRLHGYEVLVVSPDDDGWTQRILKRVNEFTIEVARESD
jgi:hypothetical protein